MTPVTPCISHAAFLQVRAPAEPPPPCGGAAWCEHSDSFLCKPQHTPVSARNISKPPSIHDFLFFSDGIFGNIGKPHGKTPQESDELPRLRGAAAPSRPGPKCAAEGSAWTERPQTRGRLQGCWGCCRKHKHGWRCFRKA